MTGFLALLEQAGRLALVVEAVREAETEAEIVAVVNAAIDLDWLLPEQLDLFCEAVEA